MKLSDLRALVKAIDANNSRENPDPDVAFWLTNEVERVVKAEYPARPIFIDCHVPPSEFAKGSVHQHRTPGRNFEFPLTLA